MTFVAQVIVNAITLASAYVVVALGLMLIFGGLDIPDFAHGKTIVVAGLVAWEALDHGWSVWLAVLCALVVGGAFSLATYLGIFSRLRDKPLAMLLAAFGLLLMIENAGIAIYGPLPKRLFLPLGQTVSVGGVYSTVINLVLIGIALAMWGLLVLAMHRTLWGIRLRAMGENNETARILGLRRTPISIVAFVLAGLFAAVAAVLWGNLYGVYPSMDTEPLLIGFVAIVVGGRGSTLGAGLVATVIAFAQSAIAAAGIQAWQDVAVFGLLIVFLVARPQGLFSQQAVRA